ncbi:MAG: SGNH/GDSL hydrolase family protein [Gammaproteobacteria bacterium]
MKKSVLALITVTISLVATLLVAETAIRFVWVPPSALSTMPTERHAIYGWALRPGITGRQVSIEFDYEFAHTEQGLRGSDLFSASRPAGVRHRILFLGDSFTYGNGSANDETFVERIHAGIAGAEVINTGVNGYGQRQQLAVLDTLGAALKPDLVVLMFFWNDVEDNVTAASPSFAVAGDGRVTRTDLDVPDSFDPLARRRAEEYRAPVERKLWRRTALYKLFKEGARGLRHRWFGGRERTIRTRAQRDRAWRETADLLRLIKLRSEEIGSTLLVVSIPDYELVDPVGRLKGQEPINIEIEDRIRAACGALGIGYVDLLPGLRDRQAASDRPLYFVTDRHFTPLGNAAVAKMLTPILEELLERHHASGEQP